MTSPSLLGGRVTNGGGKWVILGKGAAEKCEEIRKNWRHYLWMAPNTISLFAA